MDDFHVVADVEPFMVCYREYDHAIFNIYIPTPAVYSVGMLDT
jgi:hypothetical protein